MKISSRFEADQIANAADQQNAGGVEIDQNCPQCKNTKMTFTTLQLRSADVRECLEACSFEKYIISNEGSLRSFLFTVKYHLRLTII